MKIANTITKLIESVLNFDSFFLEVNFSNVQISNWSNLIFLYLFDFHLISRYIKNFT